MRQNYFTNKANSHVPADQATRSYDEIQTPSSSIRPRPSCMTVGTGSTTADAARLQTILDSGSGGSTVEGDTRATSISYANPPHLSMIPSSSGSHDHASEADHHKSTHQRWYNQHRASLGRSIERALRLLESLRDMNSNWYIHYPPIHGAQVDLDPSSPHGSAHSDVVKISSSSASALPSSPLLQHTDPGNDNEEAESSKERGKKPLKVPRLVTQQIAQEFSILKLDLKLGFLHPTGLIHTLEKGSIASLLDERIASSLRHLQSLRERLEDMSSKVLVTGDVNAGKSTFCNALLRRKILPEDQQPCTAIFCEILDARENGGVEEVHAVKIGATYDRHDERTYNVHTLQELANIVMDNTKYMQCKVYVQDVRVADESLISNRVLHIALIDAPGLNSHTTKTTAVLARQEEIGVAVFVVSASNHFTISAQDFIKAAAAEKAYLFIVVNGFDSIMDKKRCEKTILTQIQSLSPQTFKESSELVHFVSSNAIPTAPASGLVGSIGGRGDDDPSNDPKGKGKEVEKIRDFEGMEASLRRFVLEKRARSKLAPAKHYLLNMLHDINILATVNCGFAQAEVDKEAQALQEIEPQLESSRKAKGEIDAEIEKVIEETCKEVYNTTRSTLNSLITHLGKNSLEVTYPGFFNAFQYAENLKEVMLARIAVSVTECEDYGRKSTVKGVNSIKQLGLLHLADGYENLSFRPEVMFRRREDVLARQVDIPTELLDFIDWPVLGQGDKVASTSVALSVATALSGGRMLGLPLWMEQAFMSRLVGNGNLHRLIVPSIIATALIAVTCVIRQISTALPHRLSVKVAQKLAAIDYVHSNASRISGSVRKVLHFPVDNLRFGLDRLVKDLGTRRDDSLHVMDQSAISLKYFGNLVRDSAEQADVVADYDLETPPEARDD
ncbi:transmembrane GTPase fzo1 [Cadophora sp. MPI-SDFR-AT-0126]|nr:transmembrane GTPase fzo1 [Leotiomycetes sp. MPI-SDFR-AT-0126]